MPRFFGKFLFLAFIGIAMTPAVSHAVPSFARQTGMDCAACHTSFPELTPFGRDFKLHGYTLGERQLLPLAAMMQFSVTHVDKQSSSGGTYMLRQNDPTFDSLGVFLAGKINDNAGAFIQATYSNVFNLNDTGGIGHRSHADNTDIRVIGNHELFGKDVVLGLDLNNNPTVQDVWNSTPAWGFPFIGSSLAAVGGSAGTAGGGHPTQIESRLAQQVAGVGAYFWWDRQVYGEFSMYGTADGLFRPLSLGDWHDNSSFSALESRSNPYWRLAWNRDWGPHSLMVGTYGWRIDVYPDTTQRIGPTDRYTDTAIDAQYQYLSDPHIFSLQGTYIHERQTLNATFARGNSANPTDTLNTFRAKASYLYDRKYGATLYYFQNIGSADAGLYTGNATNKPNTHGYIVELDYNPTTQVRIALQYVGFTKIDGLNDGYTSTSPERKASDNNTIFLGTWFAF